MLLVTSCLPLLSHPYPTAEPQPERRPASASHPRPVETQRRPPLGLSPFRPVYEPRDVGSRKDLQGRRYRVTAGALHMPHATICRRGQGREESAAGRGYSAEMSGMRACSPEAARRGADRRAAFLLIQPPDRNTGVPRRGEQVAPVDLSAVASQPALGRNIGGGRRKAPRLPGGCGNHSSSFTYKHIRALLVA